MTAATGQTPFEALLMEIVTGAYKAGDRLVERNVVPHLGVSRTPVREAIRKLEALGLVRCVPLKGAMVSELSPTDIEAIYFLRLQLERLAARVAFYNLEKADILRLGEINRDMRKAQAAHASLFKLIERDREFHRVIYEGTQNRFLIQTIGDLQLRCYVIAYRAWREPDRVRASMEEHREIIKALKQKERRRFEDLLEHQLTSAKSFYLESFE